MVLLGVLSVLFKHPIIFILSLIFVIYCLYDFLKDRFFKEFFVRIALLLLSCAIGYGLAAFASLSYENKSLCYTDGATIALTGTVTSREIKNDKLNLTLSNNETGLDVLVYFDDVPATIPELYSKLRVSGDITLPTSPRNPGEFDSVKYYMSRGIIFRLYARGYETLSTPAILLPENLQKLRDRMCDLFSSNLDSDIASILSSIVTGDKTELTDETKDAFRVSGISHILCVSGMHISLVAAMIMWLLKKLKMYAIPRMITAIAIVSMYALFCGMSISTIRALISFIISCLAFMLGRTYDRISTLSLIMIAMLITNPFVVFSSGFVFSFWAVFSFTIISDLRIKNKIASAVVLQLLSMPVVALYYYEIPVLSFAVNLLLVPYLGVVLVSGLLGGLIGLIWPASTPFFLFPCRIILGAYIFVCDLIKKLPFSSVITGMPSLPRLIIYAVLIGVFIFLFARIRRYKPLLLTLTTVLCLTVLFIPTPPRFITHFIDVGQGDGCLICSSNGKNIFVDGGSSSKKNLGKYTLLPFLKYEGIKRIDYWIISHGDSDHVSGLIEVLENDYPISHIIMGDAPYNHRSDSLLADNCKKIISLAEKKNIPLLYAHQGQSLSLGCGDIDFLWPRSDTSYDDINSASLVFTYTENGQKMLFTGDISSKEEIEIAQYLDKRNLKNIDLLKVAHHGSKYSSDASLLSVIKPDIAIISVGKNKYGHPHADTLSRLSDENSRIYRTDEVGEISFSDSSLRCYLLPPQEALSRLSP